MTTLMFLFALTPASGQLKKRNSIKQNAKNNDVRQIQTRTVVMLGDDENMNPRIGFQWFLLIVTQWYLVLFSQCFISIIMFFQYSKLRQLKFKKKQIQDVEMWKSGVRLHSHHQNIRLQQKFEEKYSWK
jgi:hypothetical protein